MSSISAGRDDMDSTLTILYKPTICKTFRHRIYKWAIPEKIQTGRLRVVEDMECLGVLKKACRNSRGQLKKKWDFEGCSRKTHLEFPWVKGNMANLKILWGFSEKYIFNPPCLDFFWNSPICKGLSLTSVPPNVCKEMAEANFSSNNP